MCSCTPKISSFDDDDGEVRAFGRAGVVGGQIAVGGGDLGVAGVQAVGVGGDGLRLDAIDGEGEATDQAGHHQAAAGERVVAQTGGFGDIVHFGPHLPAGWGRIDPGGRLGNGRFAA